MIEREGKMRKEIKKLNRKKVAKMIQRAVEILDDVAEYDFYNGKEFQKELEEILFKLATIQDKLAGK